MTDILQILICASEKAACVARSCRKASCAETLLIAEKGEDEANSRFDKDFKTIADVLAQESAKTIIIQKNPKITDVRGEECSEIGGVSIHLKDSVNDTAELLSLLVPLGAAREMAEAAHCDVNTKFCENLPDDLPDVDASDLGIWIDPIDGTAEFIAGIKGGEDAYNRLLRVTVLIGAYLKSTGKPIIGVINQPFYNNGEGRVIWGFQHGDTYKCSENNDNNSEDKIMLMSASENSDTIEKFINSGWKVKFEAGAGNKLMKVALGEANAYLVSKGTTFRWDTCAPHAILKSKRGDVLDKNYMPIKYNIEKNLDTCEYCNKNGIIASCNKSVLDEIRDILS